MLRVAFAEFSVSKTSAAERQPNGDCKSKFADLSERLCTDLSVNEERAQERMSVRAMSIERNSTQCAQS